MAERAERGRWQRGHGDDDGPERAGRRRQGHTRSSSGGDGDRPRLPTVVADARRDLQELLGRPVERVSSAVPEDGGWRLSIDVVELDRIPDSTSVLGCYEVLLDDEGAIVEYERVRRYYRNRADEEIS